MPPCDPFPATHRSPTLHWRATRGWSAVDEILAVESPLALEISYERHHTEVCKLLAVTMRTPGDDADLALGFLLAEGLIATFAEVREIASLAENSRGEKIATQRLHLARPPREDLQRVSRALLTSSACGLCGRPSLEGLPFPAVARTAATPPLAPELIATLPDTLRRHQPGFFATGGSHGAALCDATGALLLAREDVGRHNAVDKLLGAALRTCVDPSDKILVLSGRASFELVQKAAAARIPVIVAIGAPSSLAVDLAHTTGLTLIGFARGERLNVYTHADRLDLASTVASPLSEFAPAILP